jgi:glycosidase
LGNAIINGSDNVSITVATSDSDLLIAYRPAGPCLSPQSIFIAIGSHREIGAAILPFGRHHEGSTVFLPFNANLLICIEIGGASPISWVRRWSGWHWRERENIPTLAPDIRDSRISARAGATSENQRDREIVFCVPGAVIGTASSIDFVMYARHLATNDGWGWLWGCSDSSVLGGIGDKYIPHYHELNRDDGSVVVRNRHGGKTRARIYQLFVRLFGNTNETRKQNGTLVENGVGKFADINDAALASIHEMGFTHVWLTGVLQQATATDYSEFGQPPDDTDLLKGLAGSPYAIKDYFDVCPDYAVDPAKRIQEFQELVERLHSHGLKAIIDLVANHVARSYGSCVKGDCDFGARDDTTKFFDPHNNFFYLQPDANGPPLRLPTVRDGLAVSPTCQLPGMTCDGFFQGEKTFGRVTGNNVVSWTPHLNDWYETIKLNYGFDFTDPAKSVREYPNAWSPDKPIPDTWEKIDRIIEYWQSLGVDGFRCDMSHMVPPEMWAWTIAQARGRQPDVFFMGEAYNDDPAKVPGSDPVVSQLNFGHGNVLFDLLNAGFNAVYDAPAYRALKRIYDGSGWANDIDGEITDDFICHNSVRYAENHDEVRLAAAAEWGGVGMEVGRPVSAILYGLSRGAIMLYNGQELGEPGAGAEGFGGGDARTSIFDYWSMPELVKWVNGHNYDGGRLSAEQKSLRAFYSRLVNLVGEPAFRDGKFFPLNPANRDNEHFGRLPGEQASGHWLYAFLRYDPFSGQRFLVIANLHPSETWRDVRIQLPNEALRFLEFDPKSSATLRDRLSEEPFETTVAAGPSISVAHLPSLSARYFEFATNDP